MERLISTQGLLKIHVAYNTRYQIFICTLCHTRIPLKELPSHLTYKVQHAIFDAPGYFPPIGIPHIWRKEVIHSVSLPVPKKILGMFICIEMRKHGIIIQNSDDAKKISPHPSQDSPVLGVTIYSHGYTCHGCQYSHQSINEMKHCSCTEPGMRKWISTPLQTIGQRHYQQYFPLPGYQLSSPPAAQDSAVDEPEDPVADITALMHQYKENLVSSLHQSGDRSQDFRNVHPCFTDLSIHSFLEGLNRRETGEFYSIIKKQYAELHPTSQQLCSLVRTTFDEDSDVCDPKKRDNIGLMVSHYITKFSLGYV